MAKVELKAECIRLRVEERLSLREISAKTGASKGSLSYWLQPFPLTEAERAERAAKANRYRAPKKERPPLVAQDLVGFSTEEKGHIAELAIAHRAALKRCQVYKPVFSGGVEDWVFKTPAGLLVAIQVKCVTPVRHGLPTIKLTKLVGHSLRVRYAPGDFDFIVGYDLETDTAYVFSEAETAMNSATITVRPDTAERWDKILAFRGRSSPLLQAAA